MSSHAYKKEQDLLKNYNSNAMDFFLIPFTMSKLVTSLTIMISIMFLIWISRIVRGERVENKSCVPRAFGAWPIIGHLSLLGELPHVTLGSMADKCGPIFTIKLGVHHVVVVSDSKVAKECLTTNDKVFANRPKSIVTEIMGYNYAMFGQAPYGQYWREVRKIAMHELLSRTRLEMVSEIRVSEVSSSLKDMYEFWIRRKEQPSNMVKMEMKKWFGNLIHSYVVRLIAGKHYSPEDEEWVQFQKTMHRFFGMLGAFNVSDAFPYLRWLDLGGQEKEMKDMAKDMDNIVQSWLEEHKRKRHSTGWTGEKHDFIDAIISIMEDDSVKDRLPGFDPDTIIKATSLGLLIAATDTTTVTLIWALSLLLNNPMEMKKAREELDIHVGKERQVEESDIKNLVYLQAIMKETLRLYPPGPFTVPHESMEDCTISGYHIPKGTRLLVNLWKIQRDSQVWSNPYEFKPDRFLNSHIDIDVRGQNFELIPFGSGRRMCPGISFALQIMQLTLARLIHGFKIEKVTEEAIDMSESFGLTIMKTTPLEIRFAPRLSLHLY